MSARYIVGDVFEGLATLEPDSVDLVFSSPPFLALRSYLPADHPDKAKEIGSEAIPADFLDTLLDVVEACDRVLAPHGSLCFELGDTFAGSGGRGEASLNAWNERQYQGASNAKAGTKQRAQAGNGWPQDKSLCLISTLFPASLAYGRNLLRPERETPRWRIRNLVVWARPNPPVGALGDKYRPATSYLTVATKARDRYFDLDAVREPLNEHSAKYHQGDGYELAAGNKKDGHPGSGWKTRLIAGTGAPPLDYWVIPTAPYQGSHYATFPPDLVVKPVKSMCPQRVCRVCGEPSRRIVEVDGLGGRDFFVAANGENDRNIGLGGARTPMPDITRTTTGWTDCGHNDWRPGLVLDPFAGSGTTLAVATGHGRDAIGIDLDARNADLALERVGPLLMTVETLTSEPAA